MYLDVQVIRVAYDASCTELGELRPPTHPKNRRNGYSATIHTDSGYPRLRLPSTILFQVPIDNEVHGIMSIGKS